MHGSKMRRCNKPCHICFIARFFFKHANKKTLIKELNIYFVNKDYGFL